MSSRINNKIRRSLFTTACAFSILALTAAGASAASYKVRSGDTLFLIGQRYGVSVSAIKSASGLYGDTIYPGQVITIPDKPSSPSAPSSGSSTRYTVRSGDTLFLIARRYGTTVNAIMTANSLWSSSIYPGQSLVIPGGSNGSGTNSPSPSVPPAGSYSQSDIYLLAQLVTAESAGEPYTGQVAVAATVLNRIKNPTYPSTVSGVIYQVIDGKYYQFSPVLDGRINNTPTQSALKAVQEAMSGWDPSYGAVGFYNPTKTSNYWVASRPVTTVIGAHVFFK
ncbi:MAG: Spore cortex-lytic enzyme precursor [Firmicutes bacterium ADurb.Bin506]|nr:MAG: Spore cortex-lytic enzyme precursor [Firmicutes bacterium ADurb.Bin506]